MVNELKNWCMAKLQNIEVRLAGDPCNTKLRRSSSMSEGLCEVDPGGLTVLPAGGPGDSAQCLAPHITDVTEGDRNTAATEDPSANHCFAVQVDSSPGTVRTELCEIASALNYYAYAHARLHIHKEWELISSRHRLV